MITERNINFILEHSNDDTSKLLFAAGRFEGIDVAKDVVIIEARRKIREKIPAWWAITGLSYPSSLAVEQCSSQATAMYKQQFISEGFKVADMTGGLGVDSYFLSRKAAGLTYIERNEQLFGTVRENFGILGCSNVQFINRDCTEYISECNEHFDLIFIDPARRDKASNRVYSIKGCEPNLVELKDRIFAVSPRILAKVSPMADISHTLALFPECSEIHIVAVDNECKELLLFLEKGFKGAAKIVAADIHSDRCDTFSFYAEEESSAEVKLFEGAESGYIYQPNRAILKAGAFRLVSQRFGLRKLAASTHLYHSVTPVTDFPGREFKINEVIPFNKEGIASIRKKYPAADCLAVNFPLDTNALRKKLAIREGGGIFLIATTLSDGRRVVFEVRCYLEKYSNSTSGSSESSR